MMKKALIFRQILCLSLLSSLLMATDTGTCRAEKGMVPISLDMLRDKVIYEENRSTMELDLPTLVDLMVNRNLDISISGKQIQQAKGRMIKSAAGLFPSITGQQSREDFIGGEVITGADPVDLDRITYRPTLSLDYQLDLGKGIFGLRSSYLDMKLSKKTRDRIFQKTLLDSMTAYYEWIRSIYSVELARKKLEAADARVKLSQAKYRNGFGNHIDVVKSKTLWDEERTKVLDAENKEQLAEYTLINKLNLPFEFDLVPKEGRFPKMQFGDEDKLSLPELVTYAEKYRPDLQELDLQIKSAKSQLTGLMVSGIIPKLQFNGYTRGIGPKMSQLDHSHRTYYFMNADSLQNMAINTAGGIHEVRAKIQEGILQKEKLMNQIKQDMMQAYLDSALYEKQMSQTLDKIEDSQEDYKITTARHKAGFSIKMEVLETETHLNEAKFEHISAMTNYHIAKLKLLFQLGLLTPDSIKNMGS